MRPRWVASSQRRADWTQPRCSNCARRKGRECEYPLQSSSLHQPDPQLVVLTPRRRSPSPAPIAHELYQPYLAAQYRKEIIDRMVVGLLDAELKSQRMLSHRRPSLADNILSKLPVPPESPAHSLLQYLLSTLRRSFDAVDVDPDARLACSAAAFFAGSLGQPLSLPHGHFNVLQLEYMHKVRSEAAAAPATGRLAATNVTLLLSQMLDRTPGKWRGQLRATTEWAISRGGTGWVLGVAPPAMGFSGPRKEILHPLPIALSADFNAALSVFASLTDGSLPIQIMPGPRHAWLLQSRALQLDLAPSMPDFFESMLGMPRVLVLCLANAVSLVSQRQAASEQQQSDVVKDQLEHEAATLRMELEHIWPVRLAARQDPRRIQYGGQIWRLAILILVIHKAQGFSTASADLSGAVTAILELLSEAAVDGTGLSGWLWPVLLAACATRDAKQRAALRDLLPLCTSSVGQLDHSDVANTILDTVYTHHDAGDPDYHVREAIHDHPDIDVILL
ncbi:uncharacterized protein LOC62_04G005363 [Vanrija pseudolonga]|uniref:Zn(2)-C6 fungal-type domain-containing protein n=1 Tax=Vanrija pseudolonga TaxID=143232 RepID=A0AAF0YBT1_9TREE|nr:hypothetical protein LOC62_04G005363 [Vanrija pseudolonga]